MNNLEKIQLDKMISENNVTDQTEHIRKIKHSKLIKKDVDLIISIMKKNKFLSYQELDELCLKQCNFLFINYSNIYTKLVKGEINIKILNDLIDKLKEIEDNKLTQHEASFEVGKLLKKIYIDSALKNAEKLDNKPKAKLTPKKISWKEFKQKNN